MPQHEHRPNRSTTSTATSSRARRGMTMGHAFRLLTLNLVLSITIAAFAVLVTGSFNEMSPGHWAMMTILVVGASVAGVVSTAMHVKKGTWTSVDDMAERF